MLGGCNDSENENMYRDDMEENTMELFEQTSYLYEEKMGRFLGLIEGNDTII